MTSKRKIILFIVISGLFLFAGALVYGQDSEYSDSELKMFVAAVEDLQLIQKEGNTTIEAAIKGGELSEDRFFEMYEVAKGGQTGAENFPESDRKAFNSTVDEITVIQEKMQADMIGAVEESGLDVQRFNFIMAQIQQDPSLQERVKSMIN